MTVGASGAIYGILGALLVLEYRATGTFAGQALGLIVVNLALTFAIPNISIGGHLGGLAGGILATFALAHFRYARPRSLGPALVTLIALASVVLAYVRVETLRLASAQTGPDDERDAVDPDDLDGRSLVDRVLALRARAPVLRPDPDLAALPRAGVDGAP